MQKIKAAIIGPGNIGTDLLYKTLRSDCIEPLWMVGIEPNSEGLARAKALGLHTSSQGIEDFLARQEGVDIVFDATSAYVHKHNAALLKEAHIFTVDLTPAAIGPFCVPPVNLQDFLDKRIDNVNMVTCGGQATIPMVSAVSRVQDVDYAEIIATVSSKSAGPGTRKNIDEFTRTTARGIEQVGGAAKGKAIIIINPAEPPLMMRDTIHCLTKDKPNESAICESVHDMIAQVQRYVPGYQLKNGPVFEDNRVSIYLEVQGLGDFLPKYAGNLDIMTAAALRTAEIFAVNLQQQLKEGVR